jgi:O-acetyl-ADP-ribose deacetylase (regulator of RNase III)
VRKRVNNITVETYVGDITDLSLDAIANAANSDLWMGAGVAGAIKRKGGVEIEKEAMSQGPIRLGEAVSTQAGKLQARRVIHCAGMLPGGRATYETVMDCVAQALRIMDKEGLEEIAFPAIGAGVGGLTKEESARAIVEALVEHSIENQGVRRVVLVAYDSGSEQAFEKALVEIPEGAM